MGPHNFGGGEARPKGGRMEAERQGPAQVGGGQASRRRRQLIERLHSLARRLKRKRWMDFAALAMTDVADETPLRVRYGE